MRSLSLSSTAALAPTILVIFAHALVPARAVAQSGDAILWAQRTATGSAAAQSEPQLEISDDATIVARYLEGFRTWSADGALRLVVSPRTPPSPVRPLDVSPDGRYVVGARNLATGTNLVIIDAQTGTQIASRRIANVGATVFTPDGAHVVFNADPDLHVLSVPGLAEVSRYRAPNAGALIPSPDGSAYMHIGIVPALYDITTGSETQVFGGLVGVRQAAFALGGRRVVGATGAFLAIWDTETGARRQLFTDGTTQLVMRSGGRYAVTLNPHARQGDSAIRVWDIETEGRIRDYAGHGIDFPLRGATITPDEQHLLALDARGSIVWINLMSGAVERKVNAAHGLEVRSVAMHEASGRIATGSRFIRITDAATGSPLGTIGTGNEVVNGMAFSPDGTRLATALNGNMSGGEGLVVYAMPDGSELFRARQRFAQDVAWSPDGSTIASCGLDPVVKLWNADGTLERELLGHGGWVYAVAFSPDGRLLATAGQDLTVIVWDVATGNPIRTFLGHEREVYDVVFTPDGEGVISVGNDGRVFHFTLGGSKRELERARVSLRSVDITGNGNGIVAGGEELHAYDLRSGRIVRTFVDPRRYAGGYYIAAITRDATRLYAGSADGDIIAWRSDGIAGVPAPVVSRLGIAPNPARDLLRIDLDIDRPSSVAVTIHDPLGRIVLRREPRSHAPGESIDLDVSTLAEGAYTVEVTGNGERRAGRVVIMRSR